MSEQDTREYASADDKRFKGELALEEAHEFVAKNGTETSPTLAVIDTAVPPEAGTDEGESGPEELDIVARREFGEPNPRRTHGTKSAAAAAAHWGNNVGRDGVSSAKVVAAGVAPRTREYEHPFAAAVEWAAKQGADVMTMSFSIKKNDALEAAIETALDNNICLITSAGNTDGPLSERRRKFPASHPEVITVGATDSYGERASFPKEPPRYSREITWGSTYGDKVDVSAWGVHVPALKGDDVDGTDDTPYWWEPAFHNGTSAATPVVAGVAVMVHRVNPDLTCTGVRKVLVETGVELETDHNIGPRVHAGEAVKAAYNRR